MARIRWSDNDRHFGPFTVSRSLARPRYGLGFVNKNGDGEPAYGILHVHRINILWPMPSWLIRPHREKKYWRDFSFCFADDVLFLRYGLQSFDKKDRSRCIFLPWAQFRMVRLSNVTADGQTVFSQSQAPSVRSYSFIEADGALNAARCWLEEREWRRGIRWCKWMGWIRRPIISRFIQIEFANESGPRKGSWKGGTLALSMLVEPGETLDQAFRRYCRESGFCLIGPAANLEIQKAI